MGAIPRLIFQCSIKLLTFPIIELFSIASHFSYCVSIFAIAKVNSINFLVKEDLYREKKTKKKRNYTKNEVNKIKSNTLKGAIEKC